MNQLYHIEGVGYFRKIDGIIPADTVNETSDVHYLKTEFAVEMAQKKLKLIEQINAAIVLGSTKTTVDLSKGEYVMQTVITDMVDAGWEVTFRSESEDACHTGYLSWKPAS